MSCATIGNYEGLRRSSKNLQTAAGCICDMPPVSSYKYTNIGDIDIEPSYFPQLTRWYRLLRLRNPQ